MRKLLTNIPGTDFESFSEMKESRTCIITWNTLGYSCLKKNMNASRPSGHPPVRGENVKTFSRWDHRLQRSNLFMALKRVVPRW